MKEWIVSSAESGKKLLSFLHERLESSFSLRQIKRALDHGQCELNGKAERFSSTVVGAGDRIRFHGIQKRPSNAANEFIWNFLYQDEELIVVNKPPGMTSTDERMLSIVQERIPGARLVHRLDRDTTGALIFARAPGIYEEMLLLFKNRQMVKKYLAVVDGVPLRDSGLIENYLARLSTYHGQSIWGPTEKDKGLPARTKWKVEGSGQHAALLSCYPETGRTHQIRVHLSGIGHPILGDHQYGRSFRCTYRPPRLLLHAYSLAFEHPRIKKAVEVTAPLPPDFTKAINLLIGD